MAHRTVEGAITLNGDLTRRITITIKGTGGVMMSESFNDYPADTGDGYLRDVMKQKVEEVVRVESEKEELTDFITIDFDTKKIFEDDITGQI